MHAQDKLSRYYRAQHWRPFQIT